LGRATVLFLNGTHRWRTSNRGGPAKWGLLRADSSCLAPPGINVMITILRQFFLPISDKQFGVFLKNQCYDQNFALFAFDLSQKRQFFRKKIAKIFNKCYDYFFAAKFFNQFSATFLLKTV
jgi:hypothetical protein